MNIVKNKLLTHPLFKNSAIVFAGSMGANVAGWLYHLFVGRILGTEGYGELAALLSLFYILNVPSSVIQTILVKFFSTFKAGDEKGQAKRLMRLVTTNILLLSGIGLVAIIALSGWITAFLRMQSPWYIVWLYVIFATYLVSIVNGSAIQGYQLFIASSVLIVVGMALRLIFSVAFAFFGVGWTLVGNIVSNLISYAFSFLPIRFLAGVREQPIAMTRKDALGFSVPALVTTLGITLLFSQDVLIVKHYFTSHEAGIYASLSVLGKVLFYATAAVSFVLFPVVSERSVRGQDHARIVFSGLGIIGLGCAALTAVYFLAPNIVLIAFGKAFSEAGSYMGIFAIFMSFFSLASILTQALLALNRLSVWIITTLATILQAALLFLVHDTIARVVMVNIAVSAGLFMALLLYYVYGSAKSAPSVTDHPRV